MVYFISNMVPGYRILILLCLLVNSRNIDGLKFRNPKQNPHSFLTVPEIIQDRGYPVETHYVVTPDDYILTIYRIPGPRFSQNQYENFNRISRSIVTSSSRQNSTEKLNLNHIYNEHKNDTKGIYKPGNRLFNDKILVNNRVKFKLGNHSHYPAPKSHQRRLNNDRIIATSHTFFESGDKFNGRKYKMHNWDSKEIIPDSHTLPEAGRTNSDQNYGARQHSPEREHHREEHLIQETHSQYRNIIELDLLNTTMLKWRSHRKNTHHNNPSSDQISMDEASNPVWGEKIHKTSSLNNQMINHEILKLDNRDTNVKDNDHLMDYKDTYQERQTRSVLPTLHNVAKRKKKVVLLQHCNHCSSYNYILNEPDRALAFILADKGYDVWLGNFRGTKQSRGHLYLNPDKLPFWKFTIDHLAAYDLPSIIDLVLNETEEPKLYYVGHSLGSLTFFAMLDMFPEYNDKVHVMAALAPAAYLGNSIGEARLTWLYASAVWRIYEKLGWYIVGDQNKKYRFDKNCFKGNILFQFCKRYTPNFSGKNKGYISEDYLHVVLSHSPTTTAVRVLNHFGQLTTSGKFQQFDYGIKENRLRYGQSRPPEYDVSSVKVPVGVFWTINDYVTSPKDTATLMKKLPNLVLNYRVPLRDFNHMDFVLADNAAKLVYRPLLELLDRY